MIRPLRFLVTFVSIALLSPSPCRAEADADSAHVSEIVAAQTTVDSLRAEIRRLDGDLQAMKQEYADGGDVERLIEALGNPDGESEDAPDDTRSRRHRVDALLRVITQRPGQLRFNGGATVVAHNLVGGPADGAAGSGSLDLYAHTSFGPRTLLFFAFEAGAGDGVDGELPTGIVINGDATSTRGTEGFDHLVLTEAWAEFAMLSGALTLTAGKIDLTNYFDINAAANDETAQFLSGPFVNSAALVAPASGPGVRAHTVLLHRFLAQVGLVSADSTGGTRFRDVFVIGSVGVRVLPETDRDGTFRAYVYRPPNSDHAIGWGISADQHVAGSWMLFGRFGHNNDSMPAGMAARTAWSGGLQYKLTWRDRPIVAAAAYGESRDATDAVARLFEAYVSFQLNTWTHLSPHVQVLRDDATMTDATTALGARVQFGF